MRSTPATEQLPGPLSHPDDEQCADILSVDPSHEDVQSLAERLDERREVREVVDAERVALGDAAQQPVEAREIGRLLRRDTFAFGLADVLASLLAHRRKHRLLVLREIDEQRPARLHVHARSLHSAAGELRREVVARGRLRVAEQADHEPAAERTAERLDRVRQCAVVAERATRSVRDRERRADALPEHLREAPGTAVVLEDVPFGLPSRSGFERGPPGRLKKMGTAGLQKEVVPGTRLVVGRGPSPHEGKAMRRPFRVSRPAARARYTCTPDSARSRRTWSAHVRAGARARPSRTRGTPRRSSPASS